MTSQPQAPSSQPTPGDIPPGKILLTGASGHIGANLVRRLLDEGHDLRCLVVPNANNRALDGLPVECISGDIRDLDQVKKAVQGCARIFHIAAKISTINGTPEELSDLFSINVLGTRNIVEASLKASIEKVVLTGSFSAVGYNPESPSQPSDETMPFYPFNQAMPYAHTKALAEHELYKGIARGLKATIATSCACVGPHDYLPSRMGKSLCDYARGRARAYIQGGFDFVAARDIVDGHMLAMGRGRSGQKYIFSSEFMTLGELMDVFGEVTGNPRKTIRMPPSILSAVTGIYAGTLAKRFPRLPQRLTPAVINLLTMNRHANTSKAQSELGFRPTKIREAAQEAFEFFIREGKIARPILVANRECVKPNPIPPQP